MSLVSTPRRLVVAIVLALLPIVVVTAGSGSTTMSNGPTAPTPPSGVANVSGNWTGTSAWAQGEIHAISNVTIALDQDDRAVTGTLAWEAPAYEGWSGTITGTVAGTSPDTQFVGTIELVAPAAAGRGTCTGSAVFSGRSVAQSLRWDTTQLTIAPDADGQPAAACRGLLRDVVLILGRN
jgi:hypothetical protein